MIFFMQLLQKLKALSLKSAMLLVVLCASITGISQDLVFEPFKGEGRFPSTEMHGIVEDKEGNKWVASDAGLICITGNSIKVYTRKDGLASDVVLKIYKDPLERIWISGYDGSITLIKDKKMLAIPANAQLRKFDPSSSGINQFRMGTDSCLYGTFTSGKSGIFKISKDLKDVIAISGDVDDKYLPILFPQFKLNQNQKITFLEELKKIDTLFTRGQYSKDMGITEILFQLRAFYQEDDQSFYTSYLGKIHYFRNYTIAHIYSLSDNTYSFSKIKGRIAAAVVNDGFYYLGNGISKQALNAASRYTITAFLEDREGNTWISTLQKGLFVCRNTHLQSIYDENEIISKFLLYHNEAGYLLADNSFYSFSGTPIEHHWPRNTSLSDIAFFDTETLFLSLDGLYLLKNGKLSLTDRAYYATHLRLGVNKVACWGARNLMVFENGAMVKKIITPDRFQAMAIISDSVLLAGGYSSGLWKVNINAGENNFSRILNAGRINAIQKINKTVYALGTNEKGIIVVNEEGKILKEYTRLPNRVQQLALQDNILYAGTKEGIFTINLNNDHIIGYNNSNLLPFDEIIDLKINDSIIFIAGRNSIVSLPVKEVNTFTPALEIWIDEILAGNSLRSVDNLKGISHNQNSISIKLNNYSYRSAANSKYYFTITGPNGTGQSDSSLSPTLKFSLDPGEYEVLVYAEDKLLNVRSNSFTIPISIKNPFYREWWFLLSTVALFALLFTSITLIVIRRVKNRELQKRNLVLRIADLEARALQGQMNPHFIFNAVNSVQDFILNSRTEEAHLFLSSFAKLIRMVLEHSRKKNVSLEEEISLIRLYVSIEEQRLRESVSLEVDMPDSIDAENILLPSMLLQPLVENAIWHGLNKQTGKKTITLKFREEGKLFIIEISDNGIGLQSSDQIHTSVGLEIVKERIRLTYEEAPAFDFFSIQNKSGNEGVVVRIVLPLQTEY